MTRNAHVTVPDTETDTDTKEAEQPIHTTGDLEPVGPPPFLDQRGVDEALKFVLSNWPKNAPMLAAQRETWLDVLGQLRQGELRRAISLRTDDPTHRPDPYAVLGWALQAREADRQTAHAVVRERNSQKMHDLAGDRAEVVDVDAMPEIIAAKAALGRGTK
jgi:hypothetical protein